MFECSDHPNLLFKHLNSMILELLLQILAKSSFVEFEKGNLKIAKNANQRFYKFNFQILIVFKFKQMLYARFWVAFAVLQLELMLYILKFPFCMLIGSSSKWILSVLHQIGSIELSLKVVVVQISLFCWLQILIWALPTLILIDFKFEILNSSLIHIN